MPRNLRFTHLPAIFALAATLTLPLGAIAQNQAAPDNSANNKSQNTTADQQKETASDRTITQNIRKAIMADKSLSTYAHNIKIITQDGKVTLKGPVRSEDEKAGIEAKAAAVVGAENVTNHLKVAPANP